MMALKISLKPNEKIIIDRTVMQNGDRKAVLSLLNDAMVLREKDILTNETAITPASRIYFTVQLIYMENNFETSGELHSIFWNLTKDFAVACPNKYIANVITDIGIKIFDGNLYGALKQSKNLVEYETALLNSPKSGHALLVKIKDKE